MSMTAMTEHPLRIGSGVWLDETGEQECCDHDTHDGPCRAPIYANVDRTILVDLCHCRGCVCDEEK